jgi:hypothetical protein
VLSCVYHLFQQSYEKHSTNFIRKRSCRMYQKGLQSTMNLFVGCYIISFDFRKCNKKNDLSR